MIQNSQSPAYYKRHKQTRIYQRRTHGKVLFYEALKDDNQTERVYASKKAAAALMSACDTLMEKFPKDYIGRNTDRDLTPWQAYNWLAAEIGNLVQKGIPADECLACVRSVPYGEAIANGLNMSLITEDAEIRQDFAKALSVVYNGSDLAPILGWGFSKDDLKQLGKLYKAGRFREKIIDLLEDCNFRTETDWLESGQCEEYFNPPRARSLPPLKAAR